MFPYFDMLIEKRDPQINGAEIYARDQLDFVGSTANINVY